MPNILINMVIHYSDVLSRAPACGGDGGGGGDGVCPFVLSELL